MKTVHKTALAVACGLTLSAGAHAATVAFEYSDPARFRDVRATDTSQSRFEERVLRELEAHFQKEAAVLPAGQSLRVTMQDIDLAGTVEYFHRWYPQGLRVVRNIDFPQMEFTYELRDVDGKVIDSGEAHLSDMSFRAMTWTNPRNRDPLGYEKALISEWYDRNFGS